MKPINPMRHCPMCGAPTTPPEHEGDECHFCDEPLGSWRRLEDEVRGGGLGPWTKGFLFFFLFLFLFALLTVIALWVRVGIVTNTLSI